MFIIDTSKTQADIGYLEYRAQQLMSRGIKIGDIKELRDYYISLRDKLKDDIKEVYGIENANSSKQITEYLKLLASKVELGAHNDIIDICYDDVKDKWTSEGKAMSKLADLGYSIGSDIIDYRKAKKYADSINELVEAADNNGLVHPTVTLGKTNRINYSKPGLMSIPKKLLWNLLAPLYSGDSLFSVDIKNQEPNILSNYLNDDNLKEALQSEKGFYESLFEKVYSPTVEMNVICDFLTEPRLYGIEELRKIPFVEPIKYLPKKAECTSMYYNGEQVVAIETLCQGFSSNLLFPETIKIETKERKVYDVAVEWRMDFKVKKDKDFTVVGDIKDIEFRISKSERKEFKTAWNALSYGATAFGVKQMCKLIDGGKVYKYFNGLDSFKQYKKIIDGIISNGQSAVTTLFGNIVCANETDPKRLKRILLDLPIQGTGADILSCLIKHFDEEVEKRGLKDKLFIYYTRHDELIIEANREWLASNRDKINDILKDILEHQIINKGREWYPFKVEISEVINGTPELYDDDDEE